MEHRAGLALILGKWDVTQSKPGQATSLKWILWGEGNWRKKMEWQNCKKKNYTIKKWYWTLISTVLNGLGFLLTVTDSSGFQGHEIFSAQNLALINDQWSYPIENHAKATQWIKTWGNIKLNLLQKCLNFRANRLVFEERHLKMFFFAKNCQRSKWWLSKWKYLLLLAAVTIAKPPLRPFVLGTGRS